MQTQSHERFEELRHQLQTLRAENGQLKDELAIKSGQLNRVAIEMAVTKAIGTQGYALANGALPDVLNRAFAVWQVDEEGSPVAMDGDKKLFSPDGEGQLSVNEWVDQLHASAPYLFCGIGGGANTIDRHDLKAFSENLDKIASGEVQAL